MFLQTWQFFLRAICFLSEFGVAFTPTNAVLLGLNDTTDLYKYDVTLTVIPKYCLFPHLRLVGWRKPCDLYSRQFIYPKHVKLVINSGLEEDRLEMVMDILDSLRYSVICMDSII